MFFGKKRSFLAHKCSFLATNDRFWQCFLAKNDRFWQLFAKNDSFWQRFLGKNNGFLKKNIFGKQTIIFGKKGSFLPTFFLQTNTNIEISSSSSK